MRTFGHSKQFVCFCIYFMAILKENFCSNSTETKEVETIVNVTDPGESLKDVEKMSENKEKSRSSNATNILAILNESNSVNRSELIEIFHEVGLNSTETTNEIAVNYTLFTDYVNVSSSNVSDAVQSWNDTSKTNDTLVAEAIVALNSEAPFRLPKSAAIGAGIFLVSAVFGYLSCVGYRRFLQRKYGNSEILVAEDVYDTRDLRHFEI